MCIPVEGRHGVDVRDSMKLKLFGSTLWMGSILGTMEVVMLNVGGPLWRCKVLQSNGRLVLYAKDGKRHSVYVCMGGRQKLATQRRFRGALPSPPLETM